jgi:APA family basic amino acid/polyamine antiporter
MDTASPSRPPPAHGYRRSLGLFDASMLVIGGIIGAGIFLNPAVVAQRVPSAGIAFLAWAIGGGIALVGALCFAELGARRPLAGGGYVYLRDAFGSLPAFLYGWTQLLVINSGGIAAVAYTFATYAVALGGGASEELTTGLAVATILLLSAINYFGVRPGAIVQNVFTVLKLVALGGLVAAGLTLARGSEAAAIPTGPHSLTGLIAAVGAALIPVLFAYGGWQSTNFVAEELRDPERTLPRALILGVTTVVTVYLLVNVVYLGTLGLDGLAGSSAPASDVMATLLGKPGSVAITVGIVISTFGFLNLAVLASPRMYQTMAADGVFFGAAARLHPTHHVPAVALGIQAGWAILLLSSKTYGQLLDYVVFGDWIFFGLVVATLFVYRRREPDRTVRFRVPGYPVLPLFFVVAAAFTVLSTVIADLHNAILGGALILTGIPVFFAWRWRRRSAAAHPRPPTHS